MQRFSHSKPFSRGTRGRKSIKSVLWQSGFRIDTNNNPKQDPPNFEELIQHLKEKYLSETHDFQIAVLEPKFCLDREPYLIPLPALRNSGVSWHPWKVGGQIIHSNCTIVRLLVPDESGGKLVYDQLEDYIGEYLQKATKFILIIPFFALKVSRHSPFFDGSLHDRMTESFPEHEFEGSVTVDVENEKKRCFSLCKTEDGSAFLFSFKSRKPPNSRW